MFPSYIPQRGGGVEKHRFGKVRYYAMVQKNERRSRGQLGSLKNPLEPRFADLPLRRKDEEETPRGGVYTPPFGRALCARPPHSTARRARSTHSPARSAQSRASGSSAGTGWLTRPLPGRPQSHTQPERSTREGASLTFASEGREKGKREKERGEEGR